MSYDSISIFKAFEAILVLPIHTLFLYSKNTVASGHQLRLPVGRGGQVPAQMSNTQAGVAMGQRAELQESERRKNGRSPGFLSVLLL